MKFKPTVKTNKGGTVAAHFLGASAAIVSSVNKTVGLCTLAVHEEAVRGVQKVSIGEWQTRYNPKRTRMASKPGDPPNIDFGVFIRSIQFDVDEENGVGLVGSNDKRAPWFEFGTTTMKPRPWLLPAWRKAQKKINQIIKKTKVKV